MSQVFVGNLDPRVSEKDLKDEFEVYGSICRSFSPRDRRSRRHSSNSPRHGLSIRRSLPSHRQASPDANGDRRWSRSLS